MNIHKDAYNLEGFATKIELLEHQRTLVKAKRMTFHIDKARELAKLIMSDPDRTNIKDLSYPEIEDKYNALVKSLQ